MSPKTCVLAVCLTALISGPPAHAAGKVRALSQDTLDAHPEVAAMLEEVRADPGNALLQNDLGNVYARKGWNDLALQTYRTALQADPEMFTAWANMGTLQSKMGDLGQAERSFRKAIELKPRAALAHYNLGALLDRMGLYDQALRSYKRAVTLDPSLLDPAVNPQVVNNTHLTAISLLTYLEEVGASSLPLEDSGRKTPTASPASPSSSEPTAEEGHAPAKSSSLMQPIPAAAAAPGSADDVATASALFGEEKPVLGILIAHDTKGLEIVRLTLGQMAAGPPTL